MYKSTPFWKSDDFSQPVFSFIKYKNQDCFVEWLWIKWCIWKCNTGGLEVFGDSGLGIRRAESRFPYYVSSQNLLEPPFPQQTWADDHSFLIVVVIQMKSYYECECSPTLQKLNLNNQRNRAAVRDTETVHMQSPFSLIHTHMLPFSFAFSLISLWYSCLLFHKLWFNIWNPDSASKTK